MTLGTIMSFKKTIGLMAIISCFCVTVGAQNNNASNHVVNGKYFHEFAALKQKKSQDQKYLVASAYEMPLLFSMIKKLSEKLKIDQPCYVYFITKPEDDGYNAVEAAGDLNENFQTLTFLFIGEGAFETLSDEQFEAIMAHELSHIKNDHYTKGLKLELGLIALNALTWAGFILNQANLAYPILISLGSLLGVLAYSRSCEREADHDAARVIDNPNDLGDALRALHNRNNTPLEQILLKYIDFTHPSVHEREAYLAKMAQAKQISS